MDISKTNSLVADCDDGQTIFIYNVFAVIRTDEEKIVNIKKVRFLDDDGRFSAEFTPNQPIKTNSDIIFSDSKEFVKNGIKSKTNMKTENLLPFDLEEAKKDPSRIRHRKDFIAKAAEFYSFSNGELFILWSNEDSVMGYDKIHYGDLGLTPKRMFVHRFEKQDGGIAYIEDEGGDYSIYATLEKYRGKFELIPVDKE